MSLSIDPLIKKIALKFGCVGLVVSSLYIFIFGYDLAAIPLHVVSITLFSALSLSLCQLLQCILKNNLFAKLLTYIILFVLLFIITSVYISSFLSSYFWSQPMYDKLLISSFNLLVEYYTAYFSHIPIVGILYLLVTWKKLDGPFGLLIYSLTVGIVIFIIVVPLILWICRKIILKISYYSTKDLTTRRALTQFALILITTIVIQSGFIKMYASLDWRGEVLIDTFFSESYLPYTEPYRARLAKSDREKFNSQPAIQGNGQNIVLIIVDAMRGNYVYDKDHPPPFISKLVAEGKLQTEDLAYSTCSYSLCGIPGILGSKDVVELHPDNVKIQEVLKKAGYRTYSIMSGFPDWYGMKDIYQKTYDTYIDSDIAPHETHLDDLITDELPKFDLGKTQPFFLYLRLMSTHEYGRQKTEFTEISRYEYANRVLQADDYLRQIFAILEKKGVLHNSTILITGDHGQSLGEKHEYGHNLSLYQNQIHIPILIYDESMRYQKLKFTSSLDIAPTLVERAGLSSPEFWNGISIQKNDNGDRILFHSKAGARDQTDRMRAVTYVHGDKIYKYIYTGAKKFSVSAHREELFEITSDPTEDHNLMETIDPEILAKMKAAYKDHFKD